MYVLLLQVFSWALKLFFINLQWTINTSPNIYVFFSLHCKRMSAMKVESFVFSYVFYSVFSVFMFCGNIIIEKSTSKVRGLCKWNSDIRHKRRFANIFSFIENFALIYNSEYLSCQHRCTPVNVLHFLISFAELKLDL